MNTRLTEEEYDQIKKMWSEGMRQKDISDKTGRSRSTICYVVNTMVRPCKHSDFCREHKVKKEVERKELEEVDLSSLPDHMLFKHSKEYIL